MPWTHRVEVFRSAGTQLLVLLAGALAYQLAAAYGERNWAWGLTFLNLAFASWLAVTVHRLVLLESPGASTSLSGAALWRLGRFFLAMVVVWAIYLCTRMLLLNVALLPFSGYVPAGEVAPSSKLTPDFFWAVDLVTSALAWLVLGRISLILPAIAVDQPLRPAALLRAGRGNSMRLAVVVGVLPWCLHYLIDLLYRDGATSVELALLLLLLGILLIVQVVALSLSYRALTAPLPPPIDPPG